MAGSVHSDVVELGALANFIVTVFDHLADESARCEQPLSRRTFCNEHAPVMLWVSRRFRWLVRRRRASSLVWSVSTFDDSSGCRSRPATAQCAHS